MKFKIFKYFRFLTLSALLGLIGSFCYAGITGVKILSEDLIEIKCSKPPPTVDAGTDQTVCIGDQVTLSAFNPDMATITWDNGVTDGVAFTPPSGVTVYTVTATLGPDSSTDTVIITVLPDHTISSGATRSLCINTVMTDIVLTIGGGATGANVSGLPTGVSSTLSGNTLTISGTPSQSGMFSYTVNTTGNVCNTASANGSINVSADHAISSASNQTLCINTGLTNITLTLSGGATGANVTGLPNGVNSNLSGSTITISGTPTESGSFEYTVSTTGNACNDASTNGTITVNPDNTISLTSEAGTEGQTHCLGNPIDEIVYQTTGATGASVSNLPDGVNGAWLSQILTISGTPTESGTFNYTVQGSGGCGNPTGSGTITINAPPVAHAGTDFSVCDNQTNLTLNGSVSNAGGLLWSSPGGEGNFNDPTMGGAVFTPTAAQINSGSVVLTLTTTGNPADCPPDTDTVLITFTEAFAASFSFDGPYCSDENNEVIPDFNGTSGGIFSGAPGSLNASTGGFVPESEGAGEYSITYTVPASGGCVAFETSVNVTVNAAVENVDAGDYASTVFCNQVDIALAGGADNSSGALWSVDPQEGSFSAPDQTSTDFSTGGSFTGDLTFTFTAIALPGCSDQSDTVDFLAVPAPSGQLANPPEGLCENASFTFQSADLAFNQYYDFQWEITDNQGNGATTIIGPDNMETLNFSVGTVDSDAEIVVHLEASVNGTCSVNSEHDFAILLEPVVCDFFELAGDVLVVNVCPENSDPYYYQWGCGNTILDGETENYLLYTPYMESCDDFWVRVSLYESGACPVYEGNNFPTSIHNNWTEADFLVYPNPARDYLMIQLPANMVEDGFSYRLFTLDGRCIDRNEVNGHNGLFKIDLTGIPQGAYRLLLDLEGRGSFPKSLIVLK